MSLIVKRRYPKGKNPNIIITADGRWSFNSKMRQRLGWTFGSTIEMVDYIYEPAGLWVVVFRQTIDEDGGYMFHSKGSKNGGGSLSLSELTNECFPDGTQRPTELEPIYLTNTPFDLAVVLLEPRWESITKLSIERGQWNVDQKGIYQFVNPNGNPLRIGQGDIPDRPNANIDQNAELAAEFTTVEYFTMQNARSEELRLLEQVFISRHEDRFGEIPKYNKIRS